MENSDFRILNVDGLGHRVLGDEISELPSDKIKPIAGLEFQRPLPDVDPDKVVSVNDFKNGDEEVYQFGLGYFHIRFIGIEEEARTTQTIKPGVEVTYSEAGRYSDPIKGLILGTSLTGDGNALEPFIPKGGKDALEVGLPIVVEVVESNNLSLLLLTSQR